MSLDFFMIFIRTFSLHVVLLLKEINGTHLRHHWLYRHEFEQALGDGKGQRSLACCSPWGCKSSYNVKLNNNTILVSIITFSGKERVSGFKKQVFIDLFIQKLLMSACVISVTRLHIVDTAKKEAKESQDWTSHCLKHQ